LEQAAILGVNFARLKNYWLMRISAGPIWKPFPKEG
jgi:hypothetical protein